MMRWIFAIFFVSAGLVLLRGQGTRYIALRRLTFLVFTAIGVSSLMFADQWTSLSQALGVENGTALLTYITTFTFIGYVITSYRWRVELERKIAVLSREIALKNVDKFKFK